MTPLSDQTTPQVEDPFLTPTCFQPSVLSVQREKLGVDPVGRSRAPATENVQIISGSAGRSTMRAACKRMAVQVELIWLDQVTFELRLIQLVSPGPYGWLK